MLPARKNYLLLASLPLLGTPVTFAFPVAFVEGIFTLILLSFEVVEVFTEDFVPAGLSRFLTEVETVFGIFFSLIGFLAGFIRDLRIFL